ncbi:transposase IS4 family protein [Natronorubrum bangense JCM 10635]|uniref:Transposase IS4 family protein n=1 Tax=Natronorubrum bangense JCM 10635 TaxID=1227500 RepID=L9W035_9EURY|nr:transposase IS4 family protein [Natronorubrum bangense JCM 10635]
MTHVRSDEKESTAVERVLDRVKVYLFEIELLLADRGFYNERIFAAHGRLLRLSFPSKKKLDTYCSEITTYRMYKGCGRKVEFRSRSLCHITLEIMRKAARSFEVMWRAI